VKSTPFLILAVLCGAAAVMLYRVPVQRYTVVCEQATQATCDLERATSARTQQWHVTLGPDPTAVVRFAARRRGGPRVFLYLRSTTSEVFAAEFEGGDAATAAEAAAAELNRTFHASVPGTVRITAAPPPYLRWIAWGALAVMGLLVLAGFRSTRSSA
jgi:hypothetical protein